MLSQFRNPCDDTIRSVKENRLRRNQIAKSDVMIVIQMDDLHDKPRILILQHILPAYEKYYANNYIEEVAEFIGKANFDTVIGLREERKYPLHPELESLVNAWSFWKFYCDVEDYAMLNPKLFSHESEPVWIRTLFDGDYVVPPYKIYDLLLGVNVTLIGGHRAECLEAQRQVLDARGVTFSVYEPLVYGNLTAD